MTEPPDPMTLDLGWGLGVLFRAYLREASAAFGDLPGGPRGYRLLVSAERGEPTSQRELARRLGVDRTVMTYLIDELVDAQLVERRVDPADRRANRIAATSRGRRLLPKLDRRLHDVEERVLAGLTPRDAERFRQLLRLAVKELDHIHHVADLSDIPKEMSPPPRRRSR
jgi:DNA-binding MarR family transcriptional regulator